MGEESVKKSRARRQKEKAVNGGNTTVVCTASGPNSNNIELGLLISLFILGVYVFGFYESVVSVPDVSHQSIEFNLNNQKVWLQHLGENINVARSEFTKTFVHANQAAAAAQNFNNVNNKEGDGGVSRMDVAVGDTANSSNDNNNNNNEVEGINADKVLVAEDNNISPEDPAVVKQATFDTVGGPGLLNMPEGVPDDQIAIPPHKWPVTVRDEIDTFEPLLHSGDLRTVLKVPKLWSLPIHNYKLMTHERALQIGSCSVPDEQGNVARGDQCPPDLRTIFVAVASYRDFECRTTVEDIFRRAKNPDRIRVGVVDQIAHGEDPLCNEPLKDCNEDPNQALCKYNDRVDIIEFKAELSIGPVFARHIGHRLYRGEYYATQSDAHVSYTQNWDADIIDQLEQTHNEMAVLTTYLTDVQGSIDEVTGRSLRNTRPIMCNTVYEGGPQGMHLRHASQPERMPVIHGVPQLEPWWAAGYSFSRGHFVVNVPYDPYQPMIFQGEETSIGIRGFTIGYDYYAPERSVCFHHYAVGKNANLRNKVKHFWENGDRYAGVGKKAMARLLGIVHMNPEKPRDSWNHVEEDIYGIGAVRTPEKFYETFGIDVHKKEIQEHLCMFVDEGGKMHKQFTPHLRPDGMGIDYSAIDYKFKDPLAPQ